MTHECEMVGHQNAQIIAFIVIYCSFLRFHASFYPRRGSATFFARHIARERRWQVGSTSAGSISLVDGAHAPPCSFVGSIGFCGESALDTRLEELRSDTGGLVDCKHDIVISAFVGP